MKVGFRDIDKGWKKLNEEIIKAGKSYTEVGYPSDAKESKEKYKKKIKGQKIQLTTLDVAMFQEFGTSRIPARSFIRSYFDKDNKKISKLGKKLYSEVIKRRKNTEKALGLLGEYVKAGIQKRIDEIFYPPLKSSTIKAKGSNKPLIDTGQMRASITHKEVIKHG